MQTPTTPEELFEEVDDLLAAGEYTAAGELLGLDGGDNGALEAAELSSEEHLLLSKLRARTLGELGRFSEALEESRAAEKLAAGLSEVDTLVVRTLASWFLSRLGRQEEALAAAKTAAERLEALVGPDDVRSLEARNNEARFLHRNGRSAEAMDLGWLVAGGFEEVCGPDDTATLLALQNLVTYSLASGECELAQERARVLEGRWAARDATHPKALDAKLSVLQAVAAAGENPSAAERKRLLSRYVQVLGEDHPNTERARETLAGLTAEA